MTRGNKNARRPAPLKEETVTLEVRPPWMPTLDGPERETPVPASAHDHQENWDDKVWVLNRIAKSPGSLKHAPAKFQDDFDVVLTAVRNIGNTLCHASDALRNNRDIVKKAIEKAGTALRHASQELQADREIVRFAFQRDKSSLRYASAELQQELEEADGAAPRLDDTQHGPAPNANGWVPSSTSHSESEDCIADPRWKATSSCWDSWKEPWWKEKDWKKSAKGYRNQAMQLDQSWQQDWRECAGQERKAWHNQSNQETKEAPRQEPSKWWERDTKTKQEVVDDSRQEWEDSTWKERGWTDWWSASRKAEAKESETSAMQEQSPEPVPRAGTQSPMRGTEAAFLPTPAPRYRCPGCSRQYIKFSQCRQHIADNRDCKTNVQNSITTKRNSNSSFQDPVQDLCRIASAYQ